MARMARHFIPDALWQAIAALPPEFFGKDL